MPATYPLLRLNFPSKPAILKSSLPNKKVWSSELPITATRQVLLQPFGKENPANIATNLSILNTKSNGNEYSGKKELQWVSATSQQSSILASLTVISGDTVGNKSTNWLALHNPTSKHGHQHFKFLPKLTSQIRKFSSTPYIHFTPYLT